MQALLLLASLLVERTAADTVWTELKDRLALPFFGLVLQSLESDENGGLDLKQCYQTIMLTIILLLRIKMSFRHVTFQNGSKHIMRLRIFQFRIKSLCGTCEILRLK